MNTVIEKAPDVAAAAVVEAPVRWRMLCVDDESNILSALRRLFTKHGYQVTVAESGAEGLQKLAEQPFDIIISDMRMPEMTGAQFLEQACREWPDTVRILLTGYADVASTIDAINKGQIYRYVSKPWDDQELLLVVRQALENKLLLREKARLESLTAQQNEELKTINATLELKVMERTVALRKGNEKLKANFMTSIMVFANLIELRGDGIAGHSRRVADVARKIATRMGLSEAECQDIFLAGLLHDIGKIGFPDALLTKPVPTLSGEELGRYRRHCATGEHALMALEDLRNVAMIVRAHHERFDGQGFPDRLPGLMIPLGARIIAVANDYDGLQNGSLTARRLNRDEARKMIAEQRGKRYDPQVIDAFLPESIRAEAADHADISMHPRELRPGMVLSRDLVARDGVVLLTANYVLDENLIRQIGDFARTEGDVTVFVRPEAKPV
jgi:response regulator RpfG family c-di-GMP phosphodiesterase